ncbi:MAG: lysozyme, partial [Solirubrobacteraceae bacterium]|nr:lysozyme [Solirubrobacteraceae bacterium]
MTPTRSVALKAAHEPMNRAQLEASLILWRGREVAAYRLWRSRVKRLPAADPRRADAHRAYMQARTMRKRRAARIARLGITGVSRAAVDLVKAFEGFRADPYTDSVGVWTIGYGHTKGVGPHSSPLTEQEAAMLLERELDLGYFPPVRGLPTFHALAQHQVDALTSFVYNLGSGAIASDTGIGKALRCRDWPGCADEMLEWDKAGGKALAG